MARINIEIGIKSTRRTNEPYRPTEIVITPFQIETTDEDYLSATVDVGTKVVEYIESQKENGWQNSITLAITLENTTNVDMGKGLIPMPKGHRDGAMTEIEATAENAIAQWLNDTAAELLSRAKYSI